MDFEMDVNVLNLSVAMCTYNGEKYIERQLKSIVEQSVVPDEIIIVDDLSNDRTLELADNFLKNRNLKFKIIRNTEKLGAAKNFLKAMKACTGDYVFCCDQDDVWIKDKVECFLNHIMNSSKYLYFSNGTLVDAEEKPLNCSLWKSVNFNKNLMSSNSLFELLLNHCFVTGAAMAVSKELIDKIDFIPDGWLHDGWFSLYAILNDSIEAIDSETFLYRQHNSNVVGAPGVTLGSKFKKWNNNVSRLSKMRHERFQRYLSIKENNLVSNNINLDDCILFWSELDQIKDKSFPYRLRVILKHLFNGNYNRFYTGFKGALRDIL